MDMGNTFTNKGNEMRTYQAASSNKKSTAAYNTAVADACSALEQLKAGLTAHAKDQQAGGNWGHVGDMTHLAAQLQQLAGQLNGSSQHPNEVKCPHCNKVNELANDDGFVEGPREYHAECWMAVEAAVESEADSD